ncbi:MAG TPA: VC0807 family protein [Amycolatopsis sp.]|nr:VC0807 family protein [Amycolatopsis sp.]
MTQTAREPTTNGLRPVLIDVAAPLAGYYLLSTIFGMDAVAALAWSSIVPAASAVWGLVRERRPHPLAMMMLLANAAGVTLGLLTHDARLMLVKDSAITCTIGLVLLGSVVVGRPLLSSAVESAMTARNVGRPHTWQHLRTTSARFRHAELLFSAVWGLVLLAECAVRVFAVFTLPVGTLVWLSPVLMMAAVLAGIAISRRTSMEPMARMLHTAAA